MENRPGSFDFNFDTADTREMHPGLRRVVEAEQLARAQAQEARVRTAVQLVVCEELKQVLDDMAEAESYEIRPVGYAREQLSIRMDAAAQKAREGR